MTSQKKPADEKKGDQQNYLGLAVVFFVVGAGLVVSESTRLAGLPFLVLGFTFSVLSQQKPKSQSDNEL